MEITKSKRDIDRNRRGKIVNNHAQRAAQRATQRDRQRKEKKSRKK